ncbi:MAG TPA: EF-hand domain-containing protein [Burkholderiales bacterium]|nr:EF-hand domain-containing protein [Burkholderiales bacterium]
MTVPVTCPKCSYVRKAAETAPAWQCPSCGIAYNKFRPGDGEGEPAKAARKDRRETVLGSAPAERKHMRGDAFAVVFMILLAVGIFAPLPGTWIWSWILPPMTVTAFLLWIVNFRMMSAIRNAPTSRVASAAQGFVELFGTVQYVPGCTLKAPLTQAPSVCYWYTVVENAGSKNARKLEGHDFATPFLLRDETGECLIDPNDAWLICRTRAKWEIGNVTYEEWSICVGDPVYAIGLFSSNALHSDDGLARELTVKLRSWLRDPKSFFRRFDANRDGKISTAELDAAREAARREAAQYYTAQGGMHTLTSPDNSPLIVSNLGHDKVAAEFSSRTWSGLILFFITLGATGWYFLG